MPGQVGVYWRLGQAVACALALAACNSPEVPPKPLNPEVAAFDRLQMALPGGDGPIDAEALVLAAIEYAPSRRRAEARLAHMAASVQLTEVNQPFLYAPEVEYHTEGAPWTLGLSVERPFTRETLRTARTDAAVAERVAAQWALERVGWEVRDHILKALVRIEHTRLEIAFAEEDVELRTQVEAMLRQGLQAGVSRLADAQRAAALAQQARLALDAARSRAAEAETALAAALGVSRMAVLGRGIRPPVGELLPSQVDPAQFDAMLRRALVRRSDVLVKIAAYGAAEARLRVTLAELTPDITMGPGILWDQKDLVLRLAGAIVPVPEITDARVAIALAHRDEARLAFEEMQAQVLADAESAWSQLATAGRESASAEAEITAASEYAAQTATAIRQRTLPAAAKPDADLRLLAARRAAAAAELRRQMALINLEFAMERIFSDDSVPRGAPWHRPSRDDR
ncbi:MAG: TolC family protein [Rhodospirillales bacterium]|nr:TolC family protein [Rhodospirillales bacterium]